MQNDGLIGWQSSSDEICWTRQWADWDKGGLCRQGSGNMSVAPTPRLASASMSRSLDEGSDNGRNADLDSPFDLSLAR